MQLLLIRHGTAVDSHPDGDIARPLVDKGYAQARKIARLLQRAGKLPAVCLTSPLVRARQTAESFCETAGLSAPLIQPWLACGMQPETALGELAAFHGFRSVAIFGHEPDFSAFLLHVLAIGDGAVQVKKGAVACVDIEPPGRRAILRFLVPPGLLAEDEI